MTATSREGREGIIRNFAGKLRFPYLLLAVFLLFLLNLFIPDPIPFVDELLLGFITVLLGSLRRREEPQPEKPPTKNVTPDPETGR